MTVHSTIETTGPGGLVRRFECACGYVVETSPNVPPLIVARGDSTASHPPEPERISARR